MKTHLLHCILFFLTAMPAFAQSEADSLHLLLSKAPKDVSKAYYMSALALVYRDTDLDSAAFWANQCLVFSKSISYQKGIADAFNHLGVNQGNRKNYDSAIIFHEKAFLLRKKIDDQAGMAGSLNNLGLIYRDISKLAQALDCFKQTLTIDRQLDNKQGIPLTINNIGLIYTDQGNYSLALTHYLDALSKFEALRHQEGQIRTLHNIGNTYKAQKDYQNAVIHYKKSLFVAKKVKHEPYITMSINNVSNLFLLLKQFDSALVYGQESLNRIVQTGAETKIVDGYLSVGIICRYKKAYGLARNYLQKSLDLSKKINYPEKQANILFNLSLIESEANQIEKSLTLAQESLKEVAKTENLPLVVQIKLHLSNVLQKNDQYKEALEQYIAATELRDSIFSIDDEQAKQELKANFTIDQKQKQISQLTEESLLKEHQIENQYIQIYLISTILALLVISSVAVVLFIRKKRKFDQLLHEQRLAEIAFLNSHIIRAPVATILGLVQLFDHENPSGDDNQKVIEYITESAKKLDDVVKEVVRKTYTNKEKP